MVSLTKNKSRQVIEMREVSALKEYENNPRTHSDEQVIQITNSIKEWGWTTPVLVDEDNRIITGHGRTRAARLLKLKEIPVIVAAGWTEEQKRAYTIADNKLAMNAGWDEGLLAIELGDLVSLDFDLDLMGFDLDEIDLLIPDFEGETDPDEVPEAPVNPVSSLGDVWLLGKHRLVCGDATDADTVAKCLNGVEPHLMVTDPPWGVEYDANWRNEADRANGKPYGATAIGKVTNDNRADWSEAYALFPGDVVYVWHPAGAAGLVFGNTLQTSGFDIRMVIIWGKSHYPMGRGHYHVQHEPCYYAVRKKVGSTGHWEGGRKQSTLWQIDKPRKSETGHSTQKPVECMKRPIENNSSAGQAVYDPFVGSGTTIIAAEMTGRACHAIEISPEYVDVCVKRWQDFTGEVARLESGETYEDMINKTYDAGGNSRGSYGVAIDNMRDNLSKETED